MIRTYWNWLLDRGVSDEHPEENEFIRFFNLMLFISVISSLLVLMSACLLDLPNFYLALVSYAGISYVTGIVLNHYRYIYTSRLILSISTPLWISTAHIFIGGFFSQGVAVLTSMIVTYFSFQYRPKYRIWVLITISLIYFSALTYESIYGPIWGVNNFPIDEIFVYLSGMGWTLGLVMLFEKEKGIFIKNLDQKNKDLEEASQDLERFTYIASHDLKSPVATISSFLKLIRKDLENQNYEAIEQKLSFAEGSAKQMTFLIEGILELSRIKDLKVSHKEVLQLDNILGRTKINLLDYTQKRNAIIQADQLPEFYGNEVEFSILFQNFIQNGLKYNESETPIVKISAEKTDNYLNLSFKDNGIGIDRKDFDKIFEFFQRLHANSVYQGTGLGLGMCKKIIDAYGGTIEMDSVIGEGTTFTLRFPIQQKAPLVFEVNEKMTNSYLER